MYLPPAILTCIGCNADEQQEVFSEAGSDHVSEEQTASLWLIGDATSCIKDGFSREILLKPDLFLTAERGFCGEKMS